MNLITIRYANIFTFNNFKPYLTALTTVHSVQT